MLFKRIEIENIGPISNVDVGFSENDGLPKPLIIVGENGSGKSIFLSHLVNTLIAGKQTVYDDVEVEKGKVFKYRSSSYIKAGADYSFSSIELNSGVKVQEWQLWCSKTEFEDQHDYTPARQEWRQIPSTENAHFSSSFDTRSESTKDLFKKQCCLYFPVNRFEEPAWLNQGNLTAKANYTDLKKISGYSNRDIICISPLKKNINWLLDVIFDMQAFGMDIVNFNLPISGSDQQVPIPLFKGYKGQSKNIHDAVLEVLKVILREKGNIRLGAGSRQNRQISVIKDEKNLVPNLFQLSTGEVQLLNLFLSIIRDYDLSEGQLENLEDIKGVVIIDEIDSHLHTSHQKEVLPQLIKSFPNVQFIITTHAPLFLIGMEEQFGESGFDVINMPSGERVSPSDFSEFVVAYDAFKDTVRHRDEIKKEIEQHSKPVVFVEGDYDIRYLNRAAELFDRVDLLDQVQLKDGDGFGNLDKIWRSYNSAISEVLPNKIILLYDCDTNKQDNNKNLVYKRLIPQVTDNPIKVGIENLFSQETIDRVEAENPQYIDINEGSKKRERGVDIVIPPSKSVNKDEKGNLCNWLCENGNADDFSDFVVALDIIGQAISD